MRPTSCERMLAVAESLVLRDEPAKGVVRLTLNRPEKRNALSIPLLEAFCNELDVVANDRAARVVILAGAGPVFCAGLDLQEASYPSRSEASAALITRMLETVHHLPKVTIATVHGSAVAGGAGLMSACDFVVAADGTKIGYPEVRRGLVAGLVMTFLRRQLRERDARELLLLGEIFDARKALAIGLVNRVAPAEEILDHALSIAKTAMLGAPEAIMRSKRLLERLWAREIADDFDEAHRVHLEARTSTEATEGVKAFLEKRPPAWQE